MYKRYETYTTSAPNNFEVRDKFLAKSDEPFEGSADSCPSFWGTKDNLFSKNKKRHNF